MADRLSDIEGRVQQLEEIVRELRAAALPSQAIAPTASAVAVAPPSAHPDSVVWLTLVGRSLMAFGGAFLLRALTESGRLPAAGGVIVGLGYALAWLGAAEMAATEDRRRLSGAFHGLTAVLIGVPLLLEAATRFQFLSPETSAAAIAVLALLTLAVAWHRHLHSLAAVATVASILAALVLAARTGRPVPATATVLAIGAGVMILSEFRGWRWLQWPPALAADVLVVALTTRAAAAPPLEDARTVLAIQAILVGAYTAVAVWRTAWRRDPIRPFDVVQTVLALMIGFGGAWAIVRGQSPTAVVVLAGALALLAIGAYGAALRVFAPRQDGSKTVPIYLMFGMSLVLAAGLLVLEGQWLAGSFGLLSIVLVAAARPLEQPLLVLQAAIVCLIAAESASLLGGAAVVWMNVPPWPAVSWLAMVVLVILVADFVIGSREVVPDRADRVVALAATLVLGAVVVFVVGAWLVRVTAAVSGEVNRDSVASIRAMALAVLALIVAVTGRWGMFPSARWIVYLVLVAGGLELVIDDISHSTAAKLFLDFAVYGAALILAPRIVAPSIARQAAQPL